MTLVAPEGQQPPSLSLFLRPNFEGGRILSLSVRLVIQQPLIDANQPLVSLDLEAASKPTLQYPSDAISASDSSGVLPLTHTDNDEAGTRSYIVARPTHGDVNLHCIAKPNEAPNYAPILDFRVEENGSGLLGSGLCFIPLPAGQIYTLNLEWDLHDTPSGTRAISTLGENSVTKTGPGTLFGDCFYAVGQVQSFPASGMSSNFSTYWFGKPPFNILDLAAWMEELFGKMRRFFRDEDGTYRVFARRIPDPDGTGGAALGRSFLFFYGGDNTASDLSNLLTHEMVHNWPTMMGTYAETTWYIEGIADYYSAVLPLREGMHSIDQFVEQMNLFARNYYTNPFIDVTNEAQETRSETSESTALEFLPYGRGAMFLVRLDALIRAASGGARSLDHVVLALLDRSRKQLGDTLEDFLNLLTQELGPRARQEYDDMANAQPIIMPEESLDPRCVAEKVYIPVQGQGEVSNTGLGRPSESSDPLPLVAAFQWRVRSKPSDKG